MRAPYLALAWTCEDGAHAVRGVASGLTKLGWRIAAEPQGLQLWIRPQRPAPVVVSPDRRRVLLGHRRESGGETRGMAVLTPVEAARHLSRTGWGPHLLLLRDPTDEGWWVCRDPSGAVDAYTWRNGPVAVLTSGLADLPRGTLPPGVGLDWTAIADLLRRPAAQTWRSPLAEVHVVCPGDVQPVGAGAGGARAVWRPAQHVPDRSALYPDPAWPQRLRAGVAAAVSALAEPYARLTAEVSGGLDSSIVNAALAEAGLTGRVIQTLHYVGDRREGDERAWAERMCARYGLPLVTAQLDPAGFDPSTDFADLARDLRPPFAALDPGRDRDTAARLAATASDAILTGEGGDAVFYQMPSASILADLWRSHGPRALLHPQPAAMARRLRRSLWSLWREAAARRAEPAPLGRLAGAALRGPPQGAAHPWLENLDGMTPGKRLQIEALIGACISSGPSRISGAADLLQPLLAQPLVELALSIPSWELARGDRDRGLAREAFAPWLPPAIARRRGKGALTSFYARQAAASVEVLRPYLLDGVLTEAGLLNAAAVEAALDPDQLIRSPEGLALISAAAVEAWARYWQTRLPDAPGASRWRPLSSVA